MQTGVKVHLTAGKSPPFYYEWHRDIHRRIWRFWTSQKKDGTEESILKELKEQIDPFITENYLRLSGCAEITVCYDRGQRQISKLIYVTLVSRFSNIREMKVLPVQSRLSQVADLVCTMKRIARRLEETGMLAKPESYFFGGEKNFRKNWIKSLLKNEWL